MAGWKLAAAALSCGVMAFAAAGAPAFAQETAPACTTKPVLGAEYSGWGTKGEAKSAKAEAGLKAAALPVGKAFSAKLNPTPDVTFVTLPERPGGSVSKGGMFSLTIDKPGAYFIAMGTPPWLDVVDKAGKRLEPVKFGHGPECSGIRKMVDYTLEPGTYVVQVSGSAVEALDVMVGKRP